MIDQKTPRQRDDADAQLAAAATAEALLEPAAVLACGLLAQPQPGELNQ